MPALPSTNIATPGATAVSHSTFGIDPNTGEWTYKPEREPGSKPAARSLSLSPPPLTHRSPHHHVCHCTARSVWGHSHVDGGSQRRRDIAHSFSGNAGISDAVLDQAFVGNSTRGPVGPGASGYKISTGIQGPPPPRHRHKVMSPSPPAGGPPSSIPRRPPSSALIRPMLTPKSHLR